MKRRLLTFLLAWGLSASSALAGPMINIGIHSLAPNMQNQVIAIPVTGGNAVQGLNLLVQIGDGGLALGGTYSSAPRIQDISITAGTIFASNNTGRIFDEPATDQFWAIHTTTSSGTVSATGTLALLTVDTSGFTQGSFPLLLADIAGDANSDTDFAGVPATIINGSINVPEPGTCLLFWIPIATIRGRRTLPRLLRSHAKGHVSAQQ